jgi:hypothetical protein
MRGRHNICGLDNFGSHSRSSSSDSEIVEAVRKGYLLLVKERFGGLGGGFMAKSAPAPEPVYIPPKDPWPQTKPRNDQVFAKSCIPEHWCSTEAGTTSEPASNFGQVMVAGAMLFPSASTAVATALGADLALGRMAGGGILQQRLNWAIRGAGGPASVFVLGMLPAKMAFPDAVKDKSKSSVKGGGGLRRRWKDRKGRIYEWDSENGRVELYDKQGKHLGEFNPDTGERTKDAEPGRTTPK